MWTVVLNKYFSMRPLCHITLYFWTLLLTNICKHLNKWNSSPVSLEKLSNKHPENVSTFAAPLDIMWKNVLLTGSSTMILCCYRQWRQREQFTSTQKNSKSQDYTFFLHYSQSFKNSTQATKVVACEWITFKNLFEINKKTNCDCMLHLLEMSFWRSITEDWFEAPWLNIIRHALIFLGSATITNWFSVLGTQTGSAQRKTWT